ncbi:MAG: hypothetical protein LBC89_03445 [Bacteroidales bacterium]|jgi:hypothetical protein|nr:hypothetical protein [Bacteroidales bacterium]
MNKITKYITIILLTIFLFSCKNKKIEEEMIARVYDEKLYPSDLLGITPVGVSEKDSIRTVENYVNNWVLQQIMLAKAKKNLFDEDKEIKSLVDNYRNSLIIFKYQNSLVEKMLDTVIVPQEIQEFYNNNKEQFPLSNNIMKLYFVKFTIPDYDKFEKARKMKITANKLVKNVENIKKLIFAEISNAEDFVKLSQLCEKHASSFYLDYDKWQSMNDVLREIPLEIHNQQEFLKKNHIFETYIAPNLYLVHITDYKLASEISPVEFSEDLIKNIILNNRKVELLKKISSDILQEGKERKDIEVNI